MGVGVRCIPGTVDVGTKFDGLFPAVESETTDPSIRSARVEKENGIE